jgi:hypothetical protein
MMHEVRKILQRCLFAAVAVMCFGVALSAQAQEWKPYSYPMDGFRASFPSEPQLQKSNVPTAAGTFELRNYVVPTSSGTLFIGVCDYGGKVAGTDPDTVLQGSKEGALKNTNGHLLSENKVMLGIYHGLEFESENDTLHFSARLYMVGDTLYQVLVVSPLGSNNADTARFLDSFELIPRVRS